MELSDIHCIYEGDLVEVDPNTYVPQQKMHAFLLHDSMVIASYIPNRYFKEKKYQMLKLLLILYNRLSEGGILFVQ